MLRFSRLDKPFLIITGILIVLGFFIFASASLGYLAREQSLFSSVFINQFVSLGISLIALIVAIQIKPTFWNKHALAILIGSIVATLLVFIPALSGEHGGSRRWLWLGFASFQPSELLKFGFIVYFAAWCGGIRDKIQTWKWGFLPLIVLITVAGAILLAQPDYGTLIIVSIGLAGIYFAAGASWKHLGIAAAIAGVLFLVLVKAPFVPTYIQNRITTYLNPSVDGQGASWHIQQSLIAIGSGELTGRGFGQSIQKFNYLPEPIGDSIFAVFAEEWGFVGSTLLILLFMAFLARGYRIANHAPTHFTRLLCVGFITTIVAQSFINIGAMLGIIPLTGDPLVFVSHGGSSLLMTLIEVGIILRISSHSTATQAS